MTERVHRRGSRRAFTLVEIIVVLVLIGLMTVGIGGAMRQLPSVKLKRSSTLVVSAVKTAFTRATATSKHLRVVFDLDESKVWLEEADIPMLVQSKDIAGTGGADPLTEAERAAVAEGERYGKGPSVPKPRFHPIEALGFADGGKGGKALQAGIKFREVQTAHDDAPLTKGRAYLYFWPGGLTERASIQVKVASGDDSATLSLKVAPLTGRISMKSGPVALVKPLDDKEASEREDNGGF